MEEDANYVMVPISEITVNGRMRACNTDAVADIAWFQKGSYEGPHVVDRVQGDGADKDYHEWGQDLAGTQRLIEMVTHPGEIVVDGFVCAGTTAVATLRAGRCFIGCDVDEGCVATTLNRIEAEL